MDKIWQVNRVLAVSGNECVSFISDSVINAASAKIQRSLDSDSTVMRSPYLSH